MLALFHFAARDAGLKPRAQWIPSMGASCCPFMVDRSCRSVPGAFSDWPKEGIANNNVRDNINHLIFTVSAPFESDFRGGTKPEQQQTARIMFPARGGVNTG